MHGPLSAPLSMRRLKLVHGRLIEPGKAERSDAVPYIGQHIGIETCMGMGLDGRPGTMVLPAIFQRRVVTSSNRTFCLPAWMMRLPSITTIESRIGGAPLPSRRTPPSSNEIAHETRSATVRSAKGAACRCPRSPLAGATSSGSSMWHLMPCLAVTCRQGGAFSSHRLPNCQAQRPAKTQPAVACQRWCPALPANAGAAPILCSAPPSGDHKV